MIPFLVIACGNPLRADDGVAWHIARALEEAAHDPTIQIRTVLQLTPELAEDVSQANTVVFVDAVESGEPGTVLVEPLAEPPSDPALFTHTIAPATLLSLARNLYGRTPSRAFLLTVACCCFDFSEELSQPVARAVPEAVRRIRSLE
jgi:hydrogenase maturation protease